MNDTRSISSMLPLAGPTVMRNFLVWLIHQSLQCARPGWHTLNTFFKYFNWSMEACWRGKWPEVGPDGEPLTGRWARLAGQDLFGGMFMVLWSLIGDLDYLTKTYLLPNATSNSPCAWCPCNSANWPWWDFGVDAAWRDKIYDVATWEAPGWRRCKIFDITGVTILSVYPDWMHIKTLGIDKILLGSCLWMLVHWVLPESLGSPESRLAYLWQQIFEEYERQGTPNDHRYGSIKMTMFTTKSTPKLKGKAAEVKGLGPVLHAIWLSHMNTKLELHRQIEIMLRGSCHLDSLLDVEKESYALGEDVLLGLCLLHQPS